MSLGGIVTVYHCDQVGDISGMDWQRGPGEVFESHKLAPDGVLV